MTDSAMHHQHKPKLADQPQRHAIRPKPVWQRQRALLLATTALLSLGLSFGLLPLAASNLWAAGGAGGADSVGTPGGQGGQGPYGGNGLGGASPSAGYGGGGSGSGNGSAGYGGGSDGGSGGNAGSPNGGDGGLSYMPLKTSASILTTLSLDPIALPGGSGGGGGFAGETSSRLMNTAPLLGGNGGSGQTLSNNAGAGGGGEGGYGGIITGKGFSSNTSSITGGNGGDGGQNTGDGHAGNGGDGGIGAYFTTSGVIFKNTGSITGGNGGAPGGADTQALSGQGGQGGAGLSGSGMTIINRGSIIGGSGSQVVQPFGKTLVSGAPGQGGVGITGANLSIDNKGGTIAGGHTPASQTQNYAIELTGGQNFIGTGGSIQGGIDVLGGSLQAGLPGSSVGTPLSVSGPVNFAPGSIYNVRITPAANDVILASGSASLNGAKVAVLAGQGVYTPGTRTILSASGGLNGSFSGVNSNLAFLQPQLSYTSKNVLLTLAGNAAIPGLNSNLEAIDYRVAASSGNQYAVASALTAASNALSNQNGIFTGLNQLTPAEAQNAFNGLSGEGITAAATAGLQQNKMFSDSMLDQVNLWLEAGHEHGEDAIGGPETDASLHPFGGNSWSASAPVPASLNYAPLPVARPVGPFDSGSGQIQLPPTPTHITVFERTWHTWASGFGADETVHGQAALGTAAQSAAIYGGAVGLDYQVNPNLMIGVSGGGSGSDFSVPGRAAYGNVNGGHAGFYGVASSGPYSLSSTTTLSILHTDETRQSGGFGTVLGETDRGSFDSIGIRTRIEAGRHFGSVYGANVTPFAALEIADLHSNGFSEYALSGPGALALHSLAHDTTSVPAYLGLHLDYLMTLPNGMLFRPVATLAYGHDFAPERTITNQLVTLPSAIFSIDGARVARDFAQTKIGAELMFTPRAAAFVSFDGDFSGRDQIYGGKGGFKWSW